MPDLFDKESKPTFNFPGLQDRSIAKASEITAVQEPVKKVRKSTEATVTGTKKLVLNKPKY